MDEDSIIIVMLLVEEKEQTGKLLDYIMWDKTKLLNKDGIIKKEIEIKQE